PRQALELVPGALELVLRDELRVLEGARHEGVLEVAAREDHALLGRVRGVRLLGEDRDLLARHADLPERAADASRHLRLPDDLEHLTVGRAREELPLEGELEEEDVLIRQHRAVTLA